MPYEELLGWYDYLNKRPIGWRDDLRAFRIIQAWGTKAKPQEIFSSLEPIMASPVSDKFSVQNLKGSMLFQKMLGAKGGEKLDFSGV